MPKAVFIEDLELTPIDINVEVTTNQPTGNTLRTFTFTANIKGDDTREKLKALLKYPFTFKILDDSSTELRAKGNLGNWSYSNKLDDNTVIKQDFEVNELDKDLPEDWNFLASQFENEVMNWIRTRALAELLIDKGIITYAEYEGKIKTVAERDFDNLRDLLLYGKKEPPNSFTKPTVEEK